MAGYTYGIVNGNFRFCRAFGTNLNHFKVATHSYSSNGVGISDAGCGDIGKGPKMNSLGHPKFLWLGTVHPKENNLPTLLLATQNLDRCDTSDIGRFLTTPLRLGV